MSYKGSSQPLAVITGGANGIGLATAQKLAHDGYDLFLIDKDLANLEKAREFLAVHNRKVEILNI